MAKANELNISNFARPCLATILPEAPAQVALSAMNKMGVHYLPVQDGRSVVGLLSDNHLRAALLLHPNVPLAVSDLMLTKPTVVSPEASLYEVLDEIPESVGGVTIVQNDRGEVIGLFTTDDAMRAYHSLLPRRRGSRPAVA